MRGRMKAEEAALILIEISHIDRTLLLLLPFWSVFENIKRNAPKIVKEDRFPRGSKTKRRGRLAIEILYLALGS